MLGLGALEYAILAPAACGAAAFLLVGLLLLVAGNFGGNAEFLDRVQRAAVAHHGVPHWGQLMGSYTAVDIQNLHGSDLTTWRRQLTRLIQRGRGNKSTFSNDFTATYDLEPFDKVPTAPWDLSYLVPALLDDEKRQKDLSYLFPLLLSG